MKKKIILGSANFDQSYGVKKNFINKKEIKKILNFAARNNVKSIDTSPLYNKSEKIIGLLNNRRFNIITKIPPKPKKIKKNNINKWLQKTVMQSLKNLKIKKFDCLLLHSADSLLSKDGDEFYKCIKNIKKDKLTNRIGLSIYDFNILGKILKRFKFDIVQVPLNIFDQRLLETGWLRKLKNRKMEIHVRSIFMQGILLLKSSQLPKKLKKLNKHWLLWDQWLKKNKLNSLKACVSFISNQNHIDGVVVGCNNKNQLKQILKLRQKKNYFSLPNLKIINTKLIDPREWAN